MSSAAGKTGPTPIPLPDLGSGTAAVTLVQWLVDVGDELVEGERVCEVLADGVLFSVSAPASGTLCRVNASAGQMIACGDEIGLVDAPTSD